MFKLREHKAFGAALAALLIAGCSDSTNNAASADEAASLVDVPSVEEAQSVEEVLATLQASVERAESTRGTGAPALWTLKDDDTTIHLFGTVHLLRPETEWRSPAFEAAFAASEQVVLEADTTSPKAQKAMAGLIAEYGLFTGDQKLNDVIEDVDEPMVAAALDTFGIPLNGMQTMKPWLVSLQLSVLQIQKAGFDPESGVEQILTAEANRAGKRFAYLETAEDQISILGGADIEDQVESLVFASQTLELGPKMLDSLVSEWADGDVAGLGTMVAEPDAIGGQEAYDALLVARNKNWVPQIKAMLDTPGTVFVAVGSAHFAGPDSVITMLRADGLDVAGPQ